MRLELRSVIGPKACKDDALHGVRNCAPREMKKEKDGMRWMYCRERLKEISDTCPTQVSDVGQDLVDLLAQIRRLG